jgi:NADH-quinone oxidoreductase subunit J
VISEATVTVLFYVFAALGFFAALGTVCARLILRAAVCLMCLLAVSSAYYLMLGAEFLAGVQVLVYVGGIVVLLVFAIMLTGSSDLLEAHPTLVRGMAGTAAALAFLASAVYLFSATPFPRGSGTPVADTTAALGRKLLDRGPEGYVLPFEVISLLLLAAAIGGIVVARKTPAPEEPALEASALEIPATEIEATEEPVTEEPAEVTA